MKSILNSGPLRQCIITEPHATSSTPLQTDAVTVHVDSVGGCCYNVHTPKLPTPPTRPSLTRDFVSTSTQHSPCLNVFGPFRRVRQPWCVVAETQVVCAWVVMCGRLRTVYFTIPAASAVLRVCYVLCCVCMLSPGRAGRAGLPMCACSLHRSVSLTARAFPRLR